MIERGRFDRERERFLLRVARIDATLVKEPAQPWRSGDANIPTWALEQRYGDERIERERVVGLGGGLSDIVFERLPPCSTVTLYTQFRRFLSSPYQ